MREVTIACVQFQPQLNEPEENLMKMSGIIREIGSQQKVDLIVFPELATTGFENGLHFTYLAQQVPGPAVNVMAKRASEYHTHILFGLPTKQKVESVIYNSAVLVGPDGDVYGEYRKVHLRGEERLPFREGFKYRVFETGFGLVGVMLGYELYYPEVARSLALEGAELICCLANWEQSQMREWRAL
ncbi:MAG: carbon-nitrogen hydrolase family protein, partial [Anaerolineales bacterium]|nr:carbon-nitrogen hydrolase family protein [Anaerolineales bacterium]